MSLVDPAIRPYIFLISMIRLLNSPSLDQIRGYLAGKTIMPRVEELLDELVEVGGLRREGDRYFLTLSGNQFLKDNTPSPREQREYVRSTLLQIQKCEGSTIQELALHFGAQPKDTLFKELIQQFVTMGTLDFREGGYFLSQRAKDLYGL